VSNRANWVTDWGGGGGGGSDYLIMLSFVKQLGSTIDLKLKLCM